MFLFVSLCKLKCQEHFFCNCEGNLDVKYLDDRYKRGLEKVAAYMDSHQQYLELKDLNDALPFFIEHNQKSGCQFLGCSVVVNLPTVKQLQF